jgi:maltooligosyltrehalose trehalohydrolase
MTPGARRMPIGAEWLSEGVHFRVWAPQRERVDVVLEDGRSARLQREDGGYFATLVDGVEPGALYRYRLDGEDRAYPDPASRFQPSGPHGPSEVVSAEDFHWTDHGWKGLPSLRGQVLYELHVGTFTEAGTWSAARSKLAHLQEVGVTAIELMPVAEFAGEFGWGYDGVNLFAPYHRYGRPDDFRAFVDAAHRHGIGVLLDVVYNHFGPDGNYLPQFSRQYLGARDTEWGPAINYDGEGSTSVRELVCENGAYWIAEFHVDGLRIDATQNIYDSSPEHVLTELCRRARSAAGARSVVLIAENESQTAEIMHSPEQGGHGLDGVWNDDFHHSATVALTGRTEAYYTDYLGRAQEFVAAAKYGYLYQGQRYAWQKKRRGSCTRGLPPHAFVAYIDNHDQVANTARSERTWLHASRGGYRAMTGLLLLGPWTPLLFQGQEWSATALFPYFADHGPQLATLVRKGRSAFMAQFPSCAGAEVQETLLDPAAPSTFDRARLDWHELASPAHECALALHRDLLTLRREDPVLRAQGLPGVQLDGAALSDECLLLRTWSADGDRLLITNFGRALRLLPAPEPLLAPLPSCRWALSWSSESLRYGGAGTTEVETEGDGWLIPGQSTVLLVPAPRAAS